MSAASETQEIPTLEAGAELSHYRLVERAATGNFCDVWRAVDTVSGEVVECPGIPRGVEIPIGCEVAEFVGMRRDKADDFTQVAIPNGLPERDERWMVSRSEVHGNADTAFLDGPFDPVQIGVVSAQRLVEECVDAAARTQFDQVHLLLVPHAFQYEVRRID